MKKDNGKSVLAKALIVCLGACLVCSTAPSGKSNGARERLEESVEAMGGKSASDWTTMIKTGHLTANWPGWGILHANCTEVVKKPDKVKIDQDFSAFNHPFFFTYYYNGGEAWVMVNLGVRQHPRYTSRLAQKLKTIDGVSYYLSECDTFFFVSEVPDDSLISATDIERVGIVDDGDTVLIDLDRKSHLPRRTIEEGGSRHILHDGYRSVGGRVVPFRISLYENGSMSADYEWEEIKFDEPCDDAIFEEYRPAPEGESG